LTKKRHILLIFRLFSFILLPLDYADTSHYYAYMPHSDFTKNPLQETKSLAECEAFAYRFA